MRGAWDGWREKEGRRGLIPPGLWYKLVLKGGTDTVECNYPSINPSVFLLCRFTYRYNFLKAKFQLFSFFENMTVFWYWGVNFTGTFQDFCYAVLSQSPSEETWKRDEDDGSIKNQISHPAEGGVGGWQDSAVTSCAQQWPLTQEKKAL